MHARTHARTHRRATKGRRSDRGKLGWEVAAGQGRRREAAPTTTTEVRQRPAPEESEEDALLPTKPWPERGLAPPQLLRLFVGGATVRPGVAESAPRAAGGLLRTVLATAQWHRTTTTKEEKNRITKEEEKMKKKLKQTNTKEI